MPPITTVLTAIFGVVTIGFGINACLNPIPALSFFELPAPVTPEAKLLLEVMSPVYGIRDVFMGVAMWATAYYGDRRAMGLITLAVGVVAGVDGAVCKWSVGVGEWNHWGYAPMLVVLGIVTMATGGEKVKKH